MQGKEAKQYFFLHVMFCINRFGVGLKIRLNHSSLIGSNVSHYFCLTLAVCGFCSESLSSAPLQSMTLGNKVIIRKSKDFQGEAFYLFVCFSWCLCVVCEWLLKYDDKDLQGFGLL